MTSMSAIVVLLLALSVGLELRQAVVHKSIELRMPSIIRPKNEIYLCTAYKVESSDEEYLVGFDPQADAGKAHHLLVYGCSAIDVADPNEVWDCGTMMLRSSDESEQNFYRRGPICGEEIQHTVLYAWALDAPELRLPHGVGFEVAGDSGVNYLVMEVHYTPYGYLDNSSHYLQPNGGIDDTGIIMHSISGTDHGITKRAGIYALANHIPIPVGLVQNTLKCRMKQDIVIHPIRFRTHTHNLGIEVGFYKFPQGDQDRAILIGKADPQQPQMFHPVIDNSLTIEKGDVLMSYCNFNNTRGKTVNWGQRYEDEMCNLYMMYWIGIDEKLREDICRSN